MSDPSGAPGLIPEGDLLDVANAVVSGANGDSWRLLTFVYDHVDIGVAGFDFKQIDFDGNVIELETESEPFLFLNKLRMAMITNGQQPWIRAVVTVDRADENSSAEFDVSFEY